MVCVMLGDTHYVGTYDFLPPHYLAKPMKVYLMYGKVS